MRKLNTSMICFFCGDIFSTGFFLVWSGELSHFILKAFGTLIIGVIGGLAGLLGKDLYPIIKMAIIRKVKFKKIGNIKKHNQQPD